MFCPCVSGMFLILMYILVFVLTVFGSTLSCFEKCQTVTFWVLARLLGSTAISGHVYYYWDICSGPLPSAKTRHEQWSFLIYEHSIVSYFTECGFFIIRNTQDSNELHGTISLGSYHLMSNRSYLNRNCSTSTLKLFIRYTYYCNLQFLSNVIRRRVNAPVVDIGYHVGAFWVSCTQRL